MNFFKKLFGQKNSTPEVPKSEKTAKAGDLKKLEVLLKPLIKRAKKLTIERPSNKIENQNLVSHFGGAPYFEEGEKWPESVSGGSLTFVCQIISNGNLNLPENSKILQFFYDFEENPWDTDDAGWLIKTYPKINENKTILLPKPENSVTIKFCQIGFEEIKSLPNWEGINEMDSQVIADLAETINDDEPWEAYDEAVEKLIGNSDSCSQIGGYPYWVQGDETPKDQNGKNLELLLQIDSEENADLMWGDSGMIYLFYDAKSKKFSFCLQCY